MPFIANPPSAQDEADAPNFSDFWPALKLAEARAILRLQSDITTERLTALLLDACIDVNEQLSGYVAEQQSAGTAFSDIPKAHKHQYLRAIYASAQAQLLSDMRDYDSTASGQDKADELAASIDVQRRVATLAIRSILGKSASHIELI